MGRQIALLRAVNVGKRQVPMARLKELMSAAGFEDVSTYLQSGNVFFADSGRSPDENGVRLEELLLDEFGFVVEVVMRSTEQLDAIIAANPLAAKVSDPKRYTVTFFDVVPDQAAVSVLKPEEYQPDEFVFLGRELYSWSPEGVHTNKLLNQFKVRKYGVRMATSRNWSTVLKLRELAASTAT